MKRLAESLELMPARRRRIRCITCAKSIVGSVARTPSRAPLRSSPTTRDERISPLEGTQPTFKQSPPSNARSTSATLAPRPAAPAALTSPAVPAPRTTRS